MSNNPLIIFLKRFLFAILILSIARLVFWIFNYQIFSFTNLLEIFKVFFWGAYFDVITLFYWLSPFILIHLIPGNWFYHSKIQVSLKVFFTLIIFILLTLTCIDAGYFPFSKSRLNISLFKMAGEENISIVKYILDYWWFVPVILSMVFITWKYFPTIKTRSNLKVYFQIPLNFIVLTFLVITIRGGFRLKPLRSIDAALFVSATHSQMAMSTGFNLLESFLAETIEIPKYFDEANFKKILEQDYVMIGQLPAVKQKNIVIIILESFGKEYTFPKDKGAISYAPFLKELAGSSTFYNRAYSNGTRSVDAIPAILEGVPKLTKTDFMYSNYIHNITPGFPFYLKKQGYQCDFYHGGKNGTLGFEAFLKSRGWNYYGKDQYQGNISDFDGQWGIFDGPYLHYLAKKLNSTPQPFMASVFTLSSHHPYTLPAEYKDSFKNIKEPIHKTIRYTDQCLEAFFETVKNEVWFNNTIFIITGDHSGQNFTKPYQNIMGKYEVPIILYEPYKKFPIINNSIIQHIDIIPLALLNAGYSGKIFTLGTYFKEDSHKLAFQNEEGNYQIIYDSGSLNFDGNKSILSCDWKTTTESELFPIQKNIENKLKAKIQDYNFRMVNNKFY